MILLCRRDETLKKRLFRGLQFHGRFTAVMHFAVPVSLASGAAAATDGTTLDRELSVSIMRRERDLTFDNLGQLSLSAVKFNLKLGNQSRHAA